MTRRKRKTTICLISDFWVESTKNLKLLSARHFVHGFLIHDPLENGISTQGLIEVRDAELPKKVMTTVIPLAKAVKNLNQQVGL